MVMTRVHPAEMAPAALDALRRLYEDSFPLKERTSFAELVGRMRTGDVQLWLEGEVAGFAVTNELGTPSEDVLVEYLAVRPDIRSRGIGTAALSTLTEEVTAPLVLEVEEPSFSSDPHAVRRLGFYERFGARRIPMSDSYVMPDLSGEGTLPMRLLDLVPGRRRGAWTAEGVRGIVRSIWSRSYGVDARDRRLRELLGSVGAGGAR